MYLKQQEYTNIFIIQNFIYHYYFVSYIINYIWIHFLRIIFFNIYPKSIILKAYTKSEFRFLFRFHCYFYS
jgi:hypothetical protein